MDFKNILKTSAIITVDSSVALASAISKLRSSHDAAFVFDGKKYLGAINPYYSLIKSSHPGNTKVQHCLFHAPYVTTDMKIAKIAQLFIESKLHYLPVVGVKKEFLGIVSARRLLAQYLGSHEFDSTIESFIEVTKRQKKLHTVFISDSITQALALFRKHRISKLVVVDKAGKLKGVLSHYDLITHLMAPAKSSKHNKNTHEGVLQSEMVRSFSRSLTLTLSAKHTMLDALRMIIKKQIGSVIVVDEHKIPTHILTTSDFLRMLVRPARGKKIALNMRNVSDLNEPILQRFFKSFRTWAGKIPDAKEISLDVKEQKNGGVFDAKISITPARGKTRLIHKQGKNLQKLLKDIKNNDPVK